MASIISPKAEVSPKAKIGDNCKIYPFAYIEDDVVIGDNCIIYPFVSIMNGTRMGNNNKVFQAAVIAALPQDFHFTGEESEVVIGDNNTIRENVVINRGTHKGGKTVLGNNNFLMEGAHISHDTVIGNGCVFGYGTKIAGDCVIGNGVIYSTSVVENAKTRVGDLAMIQAGTTFSKDIPPYIIAGKEPTRYCSINLIGLRRRGFSNETIQNIHEAYRLLYSKGILKEGIEEIKKNLEVTKEIQYIIDFVESSQRGIIR